MKYLLLCCAMATVLSCSMAKRKYLSFAGYKRVGTLDTQFLPLDKDFQLYVRQICRVRPVPNFYTSRDPNHAAPAERCNCDDKPAGSNMEKMEVAYLLYSPTLRKVLYITTIPTYTLKNGDERRGLYDMPIYRADSFVNVANFNTFFAGEIKGNQFIFIQKKDTLRWTFTTTDNNRIITLSDISRDNGKQEESYGLDCSLALPVSFYKRNSWTMGFGFNFRSDTIDREHITFMKHQGIWFGREKNGNEDSFFPLFEFEANVDYRKKYPWVYFGAFRMQSRWFR
ncbi:hypothetical protein [Chitinophaga solisilvae]|uniref:hypothetical protein n=1 Tax=Chitinophaga solisilvae TaxID=1233460 RepID=UPI00136811C9|nr:hypothetical protein [Chitinophaga solisilvae]